MNAEHAVRTIQSLEEVLEPCQPDQFFQEFFARKPLHIPGPAQRFSYLLNWSDLNRIVLHHRIAGPQVRLVTEGTMLPMAAYTEIAANDYGQSPRVIMKIVRKYLRKDATLIVDRVDQGHEPIAELCRMLEYALGGRVFADSFASWNRKQGFSTHFDVEEGFIMQLAGTKHWRIFKPERFFPIQSDKQIYRSPAALYWEGDLKPGDLLYIPGGWWHDAVAIGEPTLHIAVGLLPPTGVTLINQVTHELIDHAIVRMPLPRHASEAEQLEHMAKLRSAVETVMRRITVQSCLQQIDAVAPATDRLSLPLNAAADTQAIPRSAWIYWLPPRRMALRECGNEIKLEALGATFTFLKAAAPVLRDLINFRKIPFGDLCARHAESAVESFLVRLISAGLVSVAEE